MGTFPPVLLLDLELLDFNCYVFLQSDLNSFKNQVNKMFHPLYLVDYELLTLTLSVGIDGAYSCVTFDIFINSQVSTHTRCLLTIGHSFLTLVVKV